MGFHILKTFPLVKKVCMQNWSHF